ncbi:sulfite exporter TauE/SafE family protein [Zavarzinia aquatilis]|uniref:sulfite exporter TauE/SafE family protein n=1 Tax=Zavarzinia aquatilis TaxID=2211142 RepID=UPI0024349DA6|nr:sulfite exporter TauE/SafE family protein [Zavarzinia aquatilis]
MVAAAVLRAFSGFGFALAAMPLLVLVIEPARAVVLCALLSLTAGVKNLRPSLRQADRGLLKPLLIGSLIGTPLGVLVLDWLPGDVMRLLIGLGVLGSAILLWRTGVMSGAGRGLALPVGFSAGFMGGALAIPGPPIVVYLLGTEPDARKARGTLMAFFNVSAFISIAGYCVTGKIDEISPVQFGLALPCLLFGDWLGVWLFERYGAAHHRRISLLVLALIGVTATLNALR